jgi:hypothetical protein
MPSEAEYFEFFRGRSCSSHMSDPKQYEEEEKILDEIDGPVRRQ